jgi:PAS domain S-box-containing protein/putative nucleotidyltransferase with HDIG domain
MMADLFAFHNDDILGTAYLDLVHPDERLLGSKKMGSLMAGEIDFVSLERRYLAADGREFWGQLSGRRLLGAHGGHGDLLGVITDITVQKQMEEHLRAASQEWRTTFDAIGDGVCLLDGANQILKCNQAMTEFMGLPFPEIVGRKCWEVVHQTSRPIDGCPCMRLKNTKQRETMLLAQEDRWFKITVDPILNGDRGLLGVVHIISDITQAKQTEQALEESFQKLKRALSSTVQVLSSAVETRDPYTAGHQRRVAQLASAIAEELGFSREHLEGMQVLGYLHDIGKISVPAEILSRPGKISAMEFNLIKPHPQVGYDILKDVEFPWPVAQAVLQHHERLDGSGYPKGLKGRNIILEARILAVADVVEAMASHRPYRSALGIEAALEEITNNKGILYDSEVVDMCIKLFKERGFIFG